MDNAFSILPNADSDTLLILALLLVLYRQGSDKTLLLALLMILM